MLDRAIKEFIFHVWARGLQQTLEGTYGERKIDINDSIKMTAENVCWRIRIDISEGEQMLRLLSTEQNANVWMAEEHSFENDKKAAEAILKVVERFKKLPMFFSSELLQMVTRA